MNDHQKAFYWAGRVLILLTTIAGAVAAFGFMPPTGAQVAGAVAAITGIMARWCEQHVPAKEKVEPKE